MNKNEIGVGLMGYSIGRVHTHAWSNVGQFFQTKSDPKLVAICGRTEASVKSFGENYGFKKTYSDWKSMLNDPEVTVFDNCAPPNQHLDPCVFAAESGKAILCEKPLARSAEEAYEMYRSARKSGIVHMTGFNKRFSPAVLYARGLITEGRLGRINHVVATCYNIEFGEGFANPDLPLLWMFKKEVGGHGALSDIGSHVVDLARFLVGDVSSVCGAAQTLVDERPLPQEPTKKGKVDVEDIAIGCLRFANGAIGTLNVTWSQVAARDWTTVEVYGTHGSFKYNFERPNELELFLEDEDRNSFGFRTVICNSRSHPLASRFWPDQGGSYGFEQTFLAEIGHFLSSVESGASVEPIGASFYDGYLTCLINDKIIESSEEKRWLKVEPRPK